MDYTCVINKEISFDIANYDPYSIWVDIISDDLKLVKSVFKEINLIEIYRDSEKVLESSKYNSYASIQFLGENVWIESRKEFLPVLRVELTRENLIELVDKLQEKIEPTINIDTMTLDEYKNYKIGLVHIAVENDIYGGTQVTMSDGTVKTFAFTQNDQLDISSLFSTIVAGKGKVTALPFHAMNEECRLMDVASLINLYITMQTWITEKTTIANFTIIKIRNAQTKEELDNIYYGMEFDSETQDKISSILTETLNVVNIVIEELGFNNKDE